jgi:sortase (surface protein transpeptidase)
MGVVIVACGALAAAVGVTGLALTGAPGRTAVNLPDASHVRIPSGPVSARPVSGQVARPTVLIIPAIGVQARLIRLGLVADGTLQVPSSTAAAGWYQGSPRPGEVGASVIAGHVDSHRGPGAFFRLRLLHPPERVYVRRADGTLAAFRVVAVQTYDKSRFPAAAVYGPAPGPQLRLITCGGTFDPSLGSYLSNVIVFAVAS